MRAYTSVYFGIGRSDYSLGPPSNPETRHCSTAIQRHESTRGQISRRVACAADRCRSGCRSKSLNALFSAPHQIGTLCGRHFQAVRMPIFGLHWFNDRAWPVTVPFTPVTTVSEPSEFRRCGSLFGQASFRFLLHPSRPNAPMSALTEKTRRRLECPLCANSGHCTYHCWNCGFALGKSSFL